MKKYARITPGRVLIGKHGKIILPTCPWCTSRIDGWTGVALDTHSGTIPKPAVPEPGSISICSTCGHIIKFMGKGAFDKVLSEEMATMDAETIELLTKLQASIITGAKN